MELEVIDLKSKSKWNDLADSMSGNDVFYDPRYFDIMRRTRGLSNHFKGCPMMVHIHDKDNNMIYPFLVRKIRNQDVYENISDILNPYGYGGMIFSNYNMIFIRRAIEEFYNFCIENRFVTEFSRLHPFIDNQRFVNRVHPIEESGSTVYVDLMKSERQLKDEMSKPNRNSISKAERSRVEVFESKDLRDVLDFYAVYIFKMIKKNANERYMFPFQLFRNFYDSMRRNITYLFAKHKDNVVASSMFLHKGDRVYYYLSGSDMGADKVCANNKLINDAIFHFKERGFKMLCLGEGYDGNDSLFNFKAGFSNTRGKYHVYRKIIDYDKYHVLCDGEYDMGKNFFPLYRINDV